MVITVPGQPVDSCAIEIKDLSFAYADGRQALKGVNLTIGSGEKVSIVGPNGAGKSTLLLHLNGLLESNGAVKILGRELRSADAKLIREVRAQVGVVFQDPDDQLFSPTVHEDVAFGPIHMGLPPEEVEARVEQALADVGLSGYGGRMPIHMSGGEKKRAAIAAVLSMGPGIVVLDEPSAGLDPRARRGLIRLVDRFTQTVVIATHDMHMCREVFPRMVIMDDGVIVADGPTDKTLSDRELLEAHGLELP